jgi:hypothetical protein
VDAPLLWPGRNEVAASPASGRFDIETNPSPIPVKGLLVDAPLLWPGRNEVAASPAFGRFDIETNPRPDRGGGRAGLLLRSSDGKVGGLATEIEFRVIESKGIGEGGSHRIASRAMPPT